MCFQECKRGSTDAESVPVLQIVHHSSLTAVASSLEIQTHVSFSCGPRPENTAVKTYFLSMHICSFYGLGHYIKKLTGIILSVNI